VQGLDTLADFVGEFHRASWCLRGACFLLVVV
jgi:hypothetical protein